MHDTSAHLYGDGDMYLYESTGHLLSDFEGFEWILSDSFLRSKRQANRRYMNENSGSSVTAVD